MRWNGESALRKLSYSIISRTSFSEEIGAEAQRSALQVCHVQDLNTRKNMGEPPSRGEEVRLARFGEMPMAGLKWRSVRLLARGKRLPGGVSR